MTRYTYNPPFKGWGDICETSDANAVGEASSQAPGDSSTADDGAKSERKGAPDEQGSKPRPGKRGSTLTTGMGSKPSADGSSGR